MTRFFLRLSLVWMIVAVLPIPAGAGSEAISPDSDLGRLQGKWTAQAGLRRELKVALDIQGHRVDAVVTTPRGLNLRAQGEVKIDERHVPSRRQLDQVQWARPTRAPGDTGDLQARPRDVRGLHRRLQRRSTQRIQAGRGRLDRSGHVPPSAVASARQSQVRAAMDRDPIESEFVKNPIHMDRKAGLSHSGP